jgi:hypothetical protein
MRHIVLVIFLTLSLSASNRKDLPTDLPLPSDFNIDFQLASSQRARLNVSPVTGTEVNLAANKVFGDLVGTTMIAGYGLPYHWQLAVTNDRNINAGSLPDGEIIVYGGMASLLRTNQGLWAAVLSHEVAHTARRHAIREYQYRLYVAQQEAYWRARAAAGDKSANWALLGLTISANIGEKKLSRDLEHDADITGMMLMARAGYHPDNVFALHHLLRLETGDQSKFTAFFSTHPRWATRDQRDDKAYSDALAEYNRLWPDPAKSPGGAAPAVVFIGKPQSLEDKTTASARITIPMYCRNEADAVLVRLSFEKDNHAVLTADQAVRNDKGELQIQRPYQCGERSEATPFEASLISASVSKEDRKLRAHALVFNSSGALLEQSEEFDVHLPKGSPDARNLEAPPTRAAARAQSPGPIRTESVPGRSLTSALPASNITRDPNTSPPVQSTPIETNVEFRSNPAGANIDLDGKYVGVTPLTITIPPGLHAVTIRKQDFSTWQKTFTATSGITKVEAYLEQVSITLR